MMRSHRWTFLTVALLAVVPFAGYAQDNYQYPPPDAAPPGDTQYQYSQTPPDAQYTQAPPAAQYAVPPQQSAPPEQTGAPAYSQQQLDQMLAPVALYPDPLLSQILMASTYPLDIVEASRWLQDPNNAHLTGDQLEAALEQQHWDPSVKSLVPFPQVVNMMNSNLQWTEQLGDAFLANQGAVMNSVQGLRARAQTAGHLQSTPQQTVVADQGAITIQPAQPDVVYVPSYNPTVVYGAWPYPAYQPYYFPPPPGYYYSAPGIIAFGVGIGVLDWFWGWDRWDWHHHYLWVDPHRFADLNRGRAPHFEGDHWEHNPAHRHGVPYMSQATRSHFQAAADSARRNNARGFSQPARTPATPRALSGSVQRTNTNTVARQGTGRESRSFQVQSRPAAQTQNFQAQREAPAQRTSQVQRSEQSQARASQPAHQFQQRGPSVQPQRSSPVFESFSRGPEVRAQSARGSYSRGTTPAAVRSAPQQRSAPASRGGGNSGGGHGGGGHQDNHGH